MSADIDCVVSLHLRWVCSVFVTCVLDLDILLLQMLLFIVVSVFCLVRFYSVLAFWIDDIFCESDVCVLVMVKLTN